MPKLVTYFINPGESVMPKRGRKLHGAAKSAFLRRMAAGRRHAGINPPRRSGGRKRRRARVNPPFAGALERGRQARKKPRSVTGLLDKAASGVTHALAVELGYAVTNVVSRLIPVTSTFPAMAVRAAVAFMAGYGAELAFGEEFGSYVMAGGLTIPIETAITAANVPFLTGAISSDEEITRYLRGMAAGPGMGAYRNLGVGAYRNMGDGQPISMSAANMAGSGYF